MTELQDFYKEALQAEQSKEKAAASKGNKDYLVCKPGNTYYVKIVPYFASPRDTFLKYSFHGWESQKTGQFVTTGLCWKDMGQRCPVCEAGYASYSKGEKTRMGAPKSRLLLPKSYNLVNVLVVNDASNPDNEGKIKVLRYGEILAKKIRRAWREDEEGDADEFFGKLIFDFSDRGAVLKIKVGNKGDNKDAPVTYEESKFLVPREGQPGYINKTTDETKELLTGAFNLREFVPAAKSEDELRALLEEHYHATPVVGRQTPVADDDDDVIPGLLGKTSTGVGLESIQSIVDDFVDGIDGGES